MTQRYANKQYTTLSNRLVIDCAFTSGGSGTPTLNTKNGISHGVLRVSRESLAVFNLYLGNYDVVTGLQCPVTGLNELTPQVYTAIEYSGIPSIYTSSGSYAVTSSGIPYIRLTFMKPVGDVDPLNNPVVTPELADPPSGAVVRTTIVLMRGKYIV